MEVGGNSGSGTTTASATQDGSTTNYDEVLTYVIANGDNGSPSFEVTLTDGSSSSSVNTVLLVI